MLCRRDPFGESDLSVCDLPLQLPLDMKPHGASETTAAIISEERDYIYLLQGDGQMTKGPRCLPWENFSDCGKEVSHSFRKMVESSKSRLKKKQLEMFAQVNLPADTEGRHAGAKFPTEADMFASIATTPKSILYYA